MSCVKFEDACKTCMPNCFGMKKFFQEYDDLLFFKYDTYVVFKQFVGAYSKILY